MIVLIIKTCFFTRVDYYNYRPKLYTSQFLFFFCKDIIKVICTMFIIAIKDLNLYLKNKIFLLRKSTIRFKLLTQKSKTDNYYYLFSSSSQI